jgi:hypothetical protein
MGNPDAITLSQIRDVACHNPEFYSWISDRKNRRIIPHRLEKQGHGLRQNSIITHGTPARSRCTGRNLSVKAVMSVIFYYHHSYFPILPSIRESMRSKGYGEIY